MGHRAIMNCVNYLPLLIESKEEDKEFLKTWSMSS